MPIRPVDYQRIPYARNTGTLGQLLGLQAQTSGAMWSDLGNTIAGGLRQYAQERQQAPIKAQEAEIRRLQLADAQAGATARNTATVREQALNAFVATPDFEALPDDQKRRGFEKIAGPREGPKLFKDYIEAKRGPKLEERDPTKDLIDPLTGAVRVKGTPKPDLMAVPFGQSVIDKSNPAGGTVFTAPQDPDKAADNTRADQQAAEVQRHNREMERIGRMQAGRSDAAAVEIARHNRAMEENARNAKLGRPVTSGDANRIADFDTSLSDIGVLRATLAETKGATGTGAAIGASMPAAVTDMLGWGADAKKRQGVIDRVKQVIGKALEGGVLRKEDEYKYEKILPNIKDTPVVAAEKLMGLEAALSQRRSTLLESLADAGYETSRFPAERVAPSPDLSGVKPGFGRKFTDGPFKGQTWGLDEAGQPYRVN